MKVFEGSGIVTIGGKHRFFEVDDLNDFLNQYKGQRFTFSIKITDLNKSKEFLAYYWGVVIPKIRRAFKENGQYLTKTQTDEECRKRCFLYAEIENEDLSGYTTRLQSISELDTCELYDYIERLKILSAEFFHVYIDDPINF